VTLSPVSAKSELNVHEEEVLTGIEEKQQLFNELDEKDINTSYVLYFILNKKARNASSLQ